MARGTQTTQVKIKSHQHEQRDVVPAEAVTPLSGIRVSHDLILAAVDYVGQS
jgi:hypothetical protein